MAAKRPRAVANSASAMPGATTARLVLLVLAMEVKLSMMPHTVPKRPMNGAVDPTEARKVIYFSISPISRLIESDITRSTRCCRLARMVPEAVRPRSEAWRHSRIPAAKMADIGSAAALPICSKRVSSEPPDQKLSSKSAAAAFKRRMRSAFSKMIAQQPTEAPSSSSITSLTTISAERNRLVIERS